MEELTEMLTWQQLKLHSKPIGLLNIDSYYDSFLQWVRSLPFEVVHPVKKTVCIVYPFQYRTQLVGPVIFG